MSKHFCFCIPVRFGVFLFSFISFALSAISAAAGWALLHLIDTNQLSKIDKDVKDEDKQAFEAGLHKYKWAVIVGAAIFTFVALVAFFGFVGSIIRNRRMVKAYSVLTIFSFFLGSFASGFVLYATWSHNPFCVTINTIKTCTESNLSTGGKVGLTIGIVFQWFVQLYIVTIIRRYYQQLEEEREYRNDFRLNPTTGGTYEAKEGLLATQGAYPYSDNQHRFGSHA